MPLPRSVMSTVAATRAGALVAGALVAGAIAAGALLAAAPPVHALSGTADLTGIVTGVGGPLASAWVSATPVDDSGTPIAAPRSAFTDASGRYVFHDLARGSVVLLVRAPPGSGLVDTWYPGAPTASQATPVEVSTTPTTADVALPKGGSVIGRLVDATTGAPVEGTVRAVLAGAPAAGSVGARWYPGTSGGQAPGPDGFGRPGDFALSGLPPLPVRLVVEVPARSPWLPEPVTSTGTGPAGSAGPGVTAAPVVVDGSRDTTGVVLGLQRGAEIRGTVRDDIGAPVAGATVRLIGCGAGCPPPALSTQSGAYRILGIRPGTQVGVEAERAGGLLTQWYPRGDTPAAATRLRPEPGEVIAPVDFALTRASHLSVQIRDSRRDEPLRVVVRLVGQERTYHQYLAHSPLADGGARGGPGDVSVAGGSVGGGTVGGGTVGGGSVGGGGAGGGGASGSGDPPDAPIELRVGPVPPGEYVVRITPGMPDPGHLPTRWVTDTRDGTSPSGTVGTVRLVPGREARIIADAPPHWGSTVASPTAASPASGTCASGTPPNDTSGSGTPADGTSASGTPADGSVPGAGPWPGLAQGFLGSDWWAGRLDQGAGRLPIHDLDLAAHTP
jgi:uncharacterized membrane protein YgcG